MKCNHENCNGELKEKKGMEAKGRIGVYECDTCHCIFSLSTTRKSTKCPSLKIENKRKKKDKLVEPVNDGRENQ